MGINIYRPKTFPQITVENERVGDGMFAAHAEAVTVHHGTERAFAVFLLIPTSEMWARGHNWRERVRGHFVAELTRLHRGELPPAFFERWREDSSSRWESARKELFGDDAE